MNLSRIVCSGHEVDSKAFAAKVELSASGLYDLGIVRGDCVALLMRNSIEFVQITMAAGRLGAFAVPVNWHLTVDEVSHVLDDCEPKVLFVDDDLLGSLPPRWIERAAIVRVPVLPSEGSPAGIGDLLADWLDKASGTLPPPSLSPGSIVYTSGTTGKPKGVRRAAPTADQQEAMAKVRAQLYRLSPDDRVLIPGPLYHSFPNQLAINAAAAAAYVEIMPRFDAEEMLRIIQRERITSIGLAPIMFVRLLKLPLEARQAYDVSSLRWAIHAGGPCTEQVKRAMIEWWGPVIAEYYGGTETGPLTLCTSDEWLAHPGTVGRPIEGAQIRIVDGDNVDVPRGTPGEIYGRLKSYPDFTYHNQEARRAEVGLGDLVSLGDIGFQDEDGYVHLCDRARDMVVSGGVNIYPAEIEGAMSSIDGVEDCAVFGIPDPEFGETLVAYVVGPIDEAALRQELRKQIAGYKIPRRIVSVGDIARDPLGKIRKRNLRDEYMARSGDGRVMA